MGASVSEAVFEYAWEGGFVSSKEFRSVFVFRVSDLLWDVVGVEILWWPVDELLLSLILLSRVSDCEFMLLLFGSVVGELCAERYKLPDDCRFRIEGSEKLAMALEVLSRASTANENKPPRFCLDDTGDCVD
jgi:hypothetical protein